MAAQRFTGPDGQVYEITRLDNTPEPNARQQRSPMRIAVRNDSGGVTWLTREQFGLPPNRNGLPQSAPAQRLSTESIGQVLKNLAAPRLPPQSGPLLVAKEDSLLGRPAPASRANPGADWSQASDQYAENDDGLIPGRVKQVTSPRARTAIQGLERFEDIARPDPAGNATIGFGHTVTPGDRPYLAARPGPIDRRMAEALFTQDLEAAEDSVRRNVRSPSQLSQSQFDALVSLVFNIGAGNFARSRLLAEVNARNFAAAANEFSRFVRAGGTILPGLQNRRALERDMFLNGVYPP